MLIHVAFQAFLLLLSCFTTISAGHATPSPTFKHLNAKGSTTKLRRLTFNSNSDLTTGKKPGAIRVPLLHMDKLFAAHSNNDYRRRFEARMKRDAMRVSTLTRRLSGAAVSQEVEQFMTDVQYSSDYVATVGVGSPPTNQSMAMDTGSDVTWVQCQPCDSCYLQFDPVFDPKASASFAYAGCDDLTCDKVDESNRGCDDSDRCTYEVNYGDGTQTHGTMAIENITIGDTMVPNVPIGCADKVQGPFTDTHASGIIGLGGGSLSFVSQAGGLIGGVLSYCLGNWTTGSDGWLGFGSTNVPTDAKWASMILNPKHPSFYYIDLVSVTVGGEVLDISGDTFQLNPDTGEGGVVLDTGTTVTRLAQGAYEALRDKFKEKMGNFATMDGVSIFDTCYNLKGSDPKAAQVPTVLFTFSSRGMDPATITLEAKNVLFEVDYTDVTYCLAFASSDQSFSIIGNLQQEGSQITIDATREYVGFGPGFC